MTTINKVLAGLVIVLIGSQVWLFFKVYQKDSKIAYIDTAKLMQGSVQMQDLKKQLEGERAKAKANVDTLTAEFQKFLAEYEKSLSRMSAKEKALSQELLRNKQTNLVQYQQAVEQKTLGEEQKKTQELLSSINASISEYGEENDYKMIFATAPGNIAFGDQGIDVTEEIIQRVNGK